jgi:hypothetical protein
MEAYEVYGNALQTSLMISVSAGDYAKNIKPINSSKPKADYSEVYRKYGEAKSNAISKTIYKNLDEGLNFASTPAKHMENAGRYVPVDTLRDAIKSTKGVIDPRGSNALMHYTTMYKNGEMYNLEVLYDKATNTIYHFEYTRQAIGNLPKIPK